MKSLLELTGLNDFVELDELPSVPNETPSLPSPTHSDVRSKVRRPQNAFLLFSSLRHKELQRMFPGSNGSKMARFLGEEWKALPAAAKNFFFEKAKERKEEFLQEHPDYHFVRGPNKKTRQSRPRNYPNGRNFRAPATILPKNLFPAQPITQPRPVAAPLAPQCPSAWSVPIKAEHQPANPLVAQHDKITWTAAVVPEGRPGAPWSLGPAQTSPWTCPASWSSGSESESEPACPAWPDGALAVPSGRFVPSCPARVDVPKILEPASANQKRRSSAPGILDLPPSSSRVPEQSPAWSSAHERLLESSQGPSYVPWSAPPISRMSSDTPSASGGWSRQSSDLPSASDPNPVPGVQLYYEHENALRSHWSEYPYLSPSAIAETTTPNHSGASYSEASYSGASSRVTNSSGASNSGANYSGASHSGTNLGVGQSEVEEPAIGESGAMFLVPGTGDLLCGYSQLALQEDGLWYLSPMA